jgi:hypothetical protein
MAKKTTTSNPSDPDMDDYQTDSDADTLSRHAEIASDPDRHAKAVDRLKARASKAKGDHEKVKKLHQHVKKGLKKAFGGGGDVQDEKDREQADAEEIVRTKE